MANCLMRPAEVAKEFLDEARIICGNDEKKLRALFYDLQTVMGGFPANPKQRREYITGPKRAAN